MKAFVFDDEIAVKYGVDSAIMIWNLSLLLQSGEK